MVFAQTFEWFFDMSTDVQKTQIITVNAGGSRVKARLLPFFGAFKYYKLGAVTVRFVPASTLPVDPTGLSMEAGASTVDPRDQFNPGLVRITNGENFGNVNPIDGDFGLASYYSMMLDPRWFKFQLQTGFQRTAKPLYWGVGQLAQTQFPGSVVNMANFMDDGGLKYDGVLADQHYKQVGASRISNLNGSDPRGLFQTGLKEPLDWMPTDFFEDVSGQGNNIYGLASVPEVELMKIVLPPAFKTKYYYRVFVTETVLFREPVVLNLDGVTSQENGPYIAANGLDRFVGITAYKPVAASAMDYLTDVDTSIDNNGQGSPSMEG
uniref:Capsid protein n=1 Tax=Smacoviridae sp. TaxID=2715094 RepID=A0A6M3YPY0_9VIRU|nr:MAG: capsid protein [Smacoviridae sp.]